MSIFGFGKKDKNSNISTSTNTNTGNVIGSTVINDTSSDKKSAKVTLTKAEAGLERHLVSLKKEKGVDLFKHKARVVAVIDRSGSMTKRYEDGSVQDTLIRLLSVALRFDDNGELEVYAFSDGFKQLEPMTAKNYENYVEKEMSRLPYGWTNYAPVLKQILKDYNDSCPYPTFVIFITDGSNNDKSETDKIIRKSSVKKYKTFIQFIGIGNESFSYLRKLDDLDGREADNTAFLKVQEFSQLSDDELYSKLLKQYIPWLKELGLK